MLVLLQQMTGPGCVTTNGLVLLYGLLDLELVYKML